MATEPQIYNDSFTEMGSISDLKSVPSSPANSPIHSETELESPIKEKSWPKYKRFKDQSTGLWQFTSSSVARPTRNNLQNSNHKKEYCPFAMILSRFHQFPSLSHQIFLLLPLACSSVNEWPMNFK